MAIEMGHFDDAHDLCGPVWQAKFKLCFNSWSLAVGARCCSLHSVECIRANILTHFHTGFVMIVTPFELAFVSAVGWSKNYTPFPNKYTGLFITNWTVNLLFIVDILFNFLTAVYDPQLNKWLLRFDQIALHYARGWMALDVVSMLPVEYMIKSKQASAIRLLRVFRLMKLAKVLRSQELVRRCVSLSRHRCFRPKLGHDLRDIYETVSREPHPTPTANDPELKGA